MILVDDLKKQFTEKLDKTGSFDAAFTKAVWMAYLQGISEATTIKEKVQKHADR